VPGVASLARDGAKIAMLTCYDASFAAACERAGVDVLLVGDSLGMVIQGHASTLPVTLDDVVYHTQAVARGCRRPLLIADLPFGTYQSTPGHAYAAAVRVLQAGAQMVKVEGGAWLAQTIEVLVLFDALGIQATPPARFVRNFMQGADGIESALRAYVDAVKDGTFPAAEHCF
jgi:3-methyl-2-oxobutanoate hydroxymethyltransferase